MRHALPGRLLRLASLAVAATAALLTFASPALAIADGTPVPEGQYRFAVKLTMTDIPRPDGTTYNSACSAALIAPSWIITAGHCFHDVNRVRVSGPVPYATTATVGRTDLSDTNGAVVDVVSVVQAANADIALAKLAQPVYGVPVLQLSRTAPTIGETLRITGWGADNDVNPVPATHLATGEVQISSVTDDYVGVHGYQPHPDTSACVYDSGAPYFLERPHRPPLLVSVESNGPSCPHTEEETTSRVDDIVDWICQTIS
jgi:secreted trypsin-like serine protease